MEDGAKSDGHTAKLSRLRSFGFLWRWIPALTG